MDGRPCSHGAHRSAHVLWRQQGGAGCCRALRPSPPHWPRPRSCEGRDALEAAKRNEARNGDDGGKGAVEVQRRAQLGGADLTLLVQQPHHVLPGLQDPCSMHESHALLQPVACA